MHHFMNLNIEINIKIFIAIVHSYNIDLWIFKLFLRNFFHINKHFNKPSNTKFQPKNF